MFWNMLRTKTEITAEELNHVNQVNLITNVNPMIRDSLKNFLCHHNQPC